MRRFIIVAAGIVILCLVNYSVYERETLLADGQSVLLRLAPVDPRSLMQGDYMALRFAVADHIRWSGGGKEALDGHVLLTLDENKVASYAGPDRGSSLAKNQVRMRYRVRNRELRFATNAFFFQEGDAALYENARFGEFRVADNGDAILVGMRDENRMLLGRNSGND